MSDLGIAERDESFVLERQPKTKEELEQEYAELSDKWGIQTAAAFVELAQDPRAHSEWYTNGRKGPLPPRLMLERTENEMIDWMIDNFGRVYYLEQTKDGIVTPRTTDNPTPEIQKETWRVYNSIMGNAPEEGDLVVEWKNDYGEDKEGVYSHRLYIKKENVARIPDKLLSAMAGLIGDQTPQNSSEFKMATLYDSLIRDLAIKKLIQNPEILDHEKTFV